MDRKARGLLYALVFHYYLTLAYLGFALANSRTGMLIAYIIIIVTIALGFSLNVVALIDAFRLRRFWFVYGIWAALAWDTMSCFPWLMWFILNPIVNFSNHTPFLFVFFASALIVAVFTIYWVIKYRALNRYMEKYRIPMEEARVMLHNDLLEAWGRKTRRWELKRQHKKQLKEQLPPSDAPLVNESKLKDGTLLKP